MHIYDKSVFRLNDSIALENTILRKILYFYSSFIQTEFMKKYLDKNYL